MLFAFILIALIPILGILYYILHQDNFDEAHRKLLFRTAFFGMFAVPLVLVVDYLLIEYVGIDLNLFTSENTAQIYDFQGDVGAMVKDFFSGGILLSVFIGIAGMAFIEEYAKHWIVKEVDWKQKDFNRIIDGVEFSIAAALGFAFVENIVYFYLIKDAFPASNFPILPLMLRATISTIAHVLFSGIFGYYYGKAKFVGHTKKAHPKHVRKLHHFHIGKAMKVRWHRFTHFFQGKNVHHHMADVFHQDELIAEGLLIATILHTLFNFTLTLGLGYLVVPLLALEYAMIAHEFHVHKNFVKHKG